MKEQKKKVGYPVSISDLEKNDLFWMEYGSRILKFRVHRVFYEYGLLAHSVKWMKSDSILIPFEGFNGEKCIYAGKMSKLVSWLML